MAKVYKAYAPASAANLSVGFDLLGMALAPIDGSSLGDTVSASLAQNQEIEIIVEGKYKDKLPSDIKKNILYDAYLLFKQELAKRNLSYKPTKFVLDKALPVCSGLGSSAASVVAAVMALNAYHDKPLNSHEELMLMGKLEGKISGAIHYDNVAPCYFGGLQLVVDEGDTISCNLNFFDNLYIVSSFPGIKVSTSQARSILPAQYTRSDAIAYARRLAMFVHACHTQNEALATQCFVDVIAEPYRAKLIPNFDRVKEHGVGLNAVATGISGSGSSIFSIYRDLDSAKAMKEYLERNFIANADGFVNICKVDKLGARVSEQEE